MGNFNGRERRKYERYPITLKICYINLDTFFYDYAVNISHGGVYIRTSRPLDIGSEVKLKFAIPGTKREIETEGKVVRSIPGDPENMEPPGMGIEFDILEKSDIDLINTLWEESTQP